MLVILMTGGAMWFDSIRRSAWFKQLKNRFNPAHIPVEEE
jgi:hypothetical protein